MQASIVGAEYWTFKEFSFRYTFMAGVFYKPPTPLIVLLKDKGYQFLRTFGEDTLFVHKSFDRFDYAFKKYYTASQLPKGV